MVERNTAAPRHHGLGRWLARSAPGKARGTVTIAIVSDAAMRKLNRTYRGVDKPTDVLSFPSEGKSGSFPFLGEIVIARGIARKQAGSFGHPLLTELRILALHGLLHLLGYDHEADTGQMSKLETRLRRKAGLPAGLIARSS